MPPPRSPPIPSERGQAALPPTPLPTAAPLALVVDSVQELTPAMIQVRFRGEELSQFKFAPGQDLQFRFDDHGTPVMRRYTIRRADPERGLIDINLVLHGDGPAARWARDVRPGQVMDGALGPRGKITLAADADWHLFAGDETYLPGILAMLEALSPGVFALALVEVQGKQEEQEFAPAAGQELRWLHRGSIAPGDPGRLGRELERFHQPAGAGHAYLAGEARAAISLRDQLIAQGMPRERISAKGYWSRGRANAPRGEPDQPQ